MKMAQKLVAQINSYVFVGPELGKFSDKPNIHSISDIHAAENDRYVEAAMNYAQNVAVTGEILQFFPEVLAP